MSDDIKSAVETGLKGLQAKLDEAVQKYEGQIKDTGSVASEARSAVVALSEQFKQVQDQVRELAQKGATMSAGDTSPLSWGEQFVKSDEFKSLAANPRSRQVVSLEVKNTVVSDSTTVFPLQRPGVIPGDFAPLTIRQVIPSIPVSTNMVTSLREESWVNSAAEVSQGATKPESDITFEQYNVPVTTVAHLIKVSNQLLADAPAIVAHIDRKARHGLAERIDAQLLNGNGNSPNLSGLTDSGNFTAYTPVSDDLLTDAINRAKYQLWAVGHTPDVVIVNPADWGAMERTRETAGGGMYLYGMPGVAAGVNPFGVRVVLSNNMAAGYFLIAAMNTAAVLYTRQEATVELGYVNDDFARNLVTIRVEERLGLGVERPSASLYGQFSA